MTLFVDASAMVAILAFEPEREAFLGVIAQDPDPIWSALACWETVSSLRSSYRIEVEAARSLIEGASATASLRLVDVGAGELTLALDAYQTFGKGRHSAKLNFGDCFAYACAKTNNARLLYKGDDFTHTDLA